MNIVTARTNVPGVNQVADGWHYFTDYDLTILLRNLAVAGALCAAFSDGEQKGYDDAAEGEGYSRSAPDWHPGCGREVPR